MKQGQAQRMAFVDILVKWFGRARPKELVSFLGMSDATAGRLLADYAQGNQGTVRHSGHERGYHRVGSPPHTSSDKALGFLRGQSLVDSYMKGAGVTFGVNVCDVDVLSTPENSSEVVSMVLQAIADHKTLFIRYAGRNGASERIITPHRIVYAMNRYHVRSLDHSTEEFRDFVISRILKVSESNAEALKPRDAAWNTNVSLLFKINPELNAEMKYSIEMEWNLTEDGHHKIESNKAVALYVVRRMTMPTINGKPRWIPADETTLGYIL